MVPYIPEGTPPVVLVIEDDAETCRLIRGALAPAFAVTALEDAEPAIEQGAALLPDLVVVGAAPAVRVRMEPGLHDVPILLLMDPADTERRVDLLRRAAQDYVLRPLAAGELRARASNLVALKRARDILRRDLGSDADDLEALAREASLRRRELEAELAAVQGARDRADRLSRTTTAYLRTVGHELATPLASLRDGVTRLRAPAAAGHMEALCALEASVEWIAELGQALLEYARAPRGGAEVGQRRPALEQRRRSVVQGAPKIR